MEDKVVVEPISGEQLAIFNYKQILTYLRLGKSIGLINLDSSDYLEIIIQKKLTSFFLMIIFLTL